MTFGDVSFTERSILGVLPITIPKLWRPGAALGGLEEAKAGTKKILHYVQNDMRCHSEAGGACRRIYFWPA